MIGHSPHNFRCDSRRPERRRSSARARLRMLAAPLALCCLTVALQGCFLRKYVYRPVLVANSIGDSTTAIAGTRLHVYRNDEYEIY
jgi:hypothetical protein